MSVVEPGSAGGSLLGRVKSLLWQPSTTWDVIEGEAASISGLYRSYVIPLAAIPVVCNLIGMLAFGMGSIFGISFRPSPVWLIAQAAVSYALSLAMVYVLALIIEALAPSFGGTRDRMQAFKVAAYAPTASWAAGLFGLLPSISILAVIGGLYSLYLLYLGLQKLMKAPPDKATPYFAVVLVIAIVVGILIGLATSGMSRMSGPLHVASSSVTNAVVYAPDARG